MLMVFKKDTNAYSTGELSPYGLRTGGGGARLRQIRCLGRL